MRLFVIPPLAIVILRIQHPMYASSVAIHGLPSINGCPSSPLLGLMIRKSTRYSQELTEMVISCNVPTGRTIDRSANCNIIAVGLKESKPRVLQVSIVRMLIAAPKSTSVFEKNSPGFELLLWDSLDLHI
jgi:hypothetical protein